MVRDGYERGFLPMGAANGAREKSAAVVGFSSVSSNAREVEGVGALGGKDGGALACLDILDADAAAADFGEAEGVLEDRECGG